MSLQPSSGNGEDAVYNVASPERLSEQIDAWARSNRMPQAIRRLVELGLKGRRENEEASVDPHQINSLVAGAICECSKDHPDRIDPEQAKQIAKSILEALADAGLQIGPVKPRDEG